MKNNQENYIKNNSNSKDKKGLSNDSIGKREKEVEEKNLKKTHHQLKILQRF